MRGDAAVAEVLRREGVEYLFCFPHNTLIDAASAAGIRPIMPRTERTLLNMADGYSRVSNGRRLGVCTVQAGPGIENAFAGIAHAYADSVPLLVLPGQAARDRLGLPPNFDAVENYRGVTKWAATIHGPDRVPAMLRRAFSLLRSGRGAPVLLELPADVAAGELVSTDFDYTPPQRVRPSADPEAIRQAARALCEAELPVLHAGQGVLWSEAGPELAALAEAAGAPVVTTLAGKSAMAEDHPLAAGYVGYTGALPAYDLLREADLVFGVGTSFSRSLLSAPLPPGKRVLQLTIDERDLNKEYALEVGIQGDAKLALTALVEEVRRLGGGRTGAQQRGADVTGRREAWLARWAPKRTSDEVPINPYRVIEDLINVADRRRTIVTHDSGNPRDQLAPFWPALFPRGYVGWGKSTQLGYSMGLIMGAKLAAPEKLCVNVMGDAAFGMAGLELETAARMRIPILTIVLNNSAMGNYEKNMPVATERYGLKYLSGNYAKVADGLGVFSQRVTEPADIVPALRRAIEAVEGGEPALVEMITREEGAFSRP
ncbi:MAG: thiamine pyrophosphate-requiring protein [Pirellulales bacterium]